MTIQRKTIEIDATNKAVGRIATEVATCLRGKHKPEFEPHIDAGDFVRVINASKVSFTGKKLFSSHTLSGWIKKDFHEKGI